MIATRKQLSILYTLLENTTFKWNNIVKVNNIYNSIENICVKTDDLRFDIQTKFKDEVENINKEDKKEVKKLEKKYIKQIKDVEDEKVELEEITDLKEIFENNLDFKWKVNIENMIEFYNNNIK